MDKEQIIIDGIIINACLVSEKCKEFETCKIKNILRQLARKTQEYNNLANILHATTIYPEICDRCKDEILIYPMISGKTSYTDHEVDLETLIAIVDRLKYKTQECEELKTENEELNDRMAEVTFRATGGRLSYSNYTLDAIEKAFNDQLEILSDQKVEEETKELEKEIEILTKEICNTRVGVYGDIQPTVFGKSLGEIHKILTEADRYHKECEELKKKIETYKCSTNCHKYIEADRYRKTLEEIEEVINGYMNKNELYNRRLNKIFDIISKAKGEAND